MTGRVQQGKITALFNDFSSGRLDLGAVRNWLNAVQHLPDDHHVAFGGLRDTTGDPFNRPLSGGILEVVENVPEATP